LRNLKEMARGGPMARSDLLIALVKAGSSGDTRGVRSAAEAIIAEERAKQHNILATRLSQATQVNGSTHSALIAPEQSGRGREFIAEITPRRRLEDLVLGEGCRQSVTELIEEQQRASLLRSHGVDPRRSVLLVGPAGNGKTSLAEAVAEALAVPFFVVRYEAMIGSFLGETASRLKRVFDYARTTPCVLLFDEFDAVGKERGDIHETAEIKRVVTSLLMQVDDLPSYTIIVAATNHAELLDRAVWRRFQLRLGLPAPTIKELRSYFEKFFESLDEKPSISASTIVKRLGRISYAEAEQFTSMCVGDGFCR
jgi:SpoVK/Ycf46/Vps4 family AAA+-type ATPase